jgi:hypothetical protein
MMVVSMSAVVAVAAIAYALGTTTAPDVVRGQRFELIDAEGRVCASLTVVDGGPGLLLYDQDGRVRSRLCVDANEGPSLQLLDAEGRERAILGSARLVNQGGFCGTGMVQPVSSLALLNERGELGAELVVPGDAGSALALHGKEGDRVWTAP